MGKGKIDVALFSCAFLFITLFTIQPAIAAEEDSGLSPQTFTEDRVSLQVVSGFISSPTELASGSIDMDYWQTNLRLGWMFSNLKMADSWLRGRFETLIEGTYSIITVGPGDYLAGITALLRYNFLQPDWKFVPYFQIGAGVIYNDSYKDRTQNSIGQSIEFTPQMSAGFRYLINPRWSLDAEAIFHHISNASLDDRNAGINAFGGFVGLTYYFPTPVK